MEYQQVSCIFIPDELELLKFLFRFLITLFVKSGQVFYRV